MRGNPLRGLAGDDKMQTRQPIRVAPIRIALGCVLIVGVIACAKHEPGAEASMEAASPAMAAADAGGAAESKVASQAPTDAQLTSSAATYTDAQRKFIRTAQAKFRVKDVYQSALAIEDAVAAQGGFVTKNDIDTNIDAIRKRSLGNGQLVELAEYTVRGELTVRVPSDKTQAFLRSIIGQMEFLDTRSFAATDAQFALLREQLPTSATRRHSWNWVMPRTKAASWARRPR